MVETTTRLWYELPAVLRLAEHTRRATADDRRRFGAPNVPSLLFTHDWRHLLTSTAVPVPLREHTLRPRHVDGWTVPPHAPTRYHHLPLTRPAALPGRQLGDLLRRGARVGHHWFTIDIGTARGLALLGLSTRDWRVVEVAPTDACWRPATVTANGLGPYPAQVAVGYRARNGAVLARFDRDTVRQLAEDSTTMATYPWRTPLVVLDPHRDRVVITAHGDRGGSPFSTVRPDTGGWYRITDIGLPWTAEPDRDDPDDPVFEQVGPDGEVRCTVCGSIEDPDHQSWPSMLGSGEDWSTRCILCGSTESSHPFTADLIVRRGIWPPPTNQRP